MEFDKVNKEHILEAIKDFEEKGAPSGLSESQYYDIIINGNLYPPKPIMAYANYHATGKEPSNYFSGGKNTPCFKAFYRLNIEIKKKSSNKNIYQFIEKYKELLKSTDENSNYNELYKWETIQHFQDNWENQIHPENIISNLKKSFNKENNNLWSGSHYLPYKMLLHFAEKNPDSLCNMFKVLFDESKKLDERLYYFEKESKNITDKIWPKENLAHYQGKRAMSLYLCLKYPNKYFLYKNNMFNDFCEITGYWTKYGRSKKYDYTVIHDYHEMCNNLNEIISYDKELLQLHKNRLPKNITFEKSNNLLIQDFIYAVSSYLKPKSKYPKEHNLLIERLQLLGYEESTNMYKILDRIINELNLELNDKRICYSLDNKSSIGLTIGEKYCAAAEVKKKNSKFYYIHNTNNKEWWKETSSFSEMYNHIESILISCKKQLDITAKSRNLRHNSEALEKTMFDENYRKEIFKIAFNGTIMKKNQNLKSAFIEWLINNPKVNYFNNKKSGLNTALDKYNSFFQIDIFSCNETNYNGILSELKKTLYNENKNEFLTYSEKESNHQPRAILGKPNYMKFLKEWFNKSTTISIPTNTILYGPPGTGKTYNTKNKALDIVNPDFNTSARKDIKEQYNKYVEKGQITFVTFHQSMSYEEFVEGIKPKTVDNNVTYNIENGLFKRMVNRALYAFHNNNELNNLNEHLTFDAVYDQFLNYLNDKIEENKGEFVVPLKSKGYTLKVLSIEDEDIWTQGSSSKTEVKVTKEKLRSVFNKFKSVNEIKNVVVDIRGLDVSIGWHSNYFGVFKELKNFQENNFDKKEMESSNLEINYTEDKKIASFLNSLPNKYDVNSDQNVDQFVMVIDEINRGNVSNIFAELITLLEQDKRLGNKEELFLDLSYSKSKFIVPPNLHIIGTMNTADRSVEALDTALRRRFSFEEMMPNTSLITTEIDGISLSEVLTTINERIEVLVDRDHTIGHSYLMDVDSKESLRLAFKDKIIPLLQEYFYGDYGKIGLVLGDGFVKKKDKNDNLFSNFNYDGDSDDLNQGGYELIPIDDDFKIIKGLKLLLNIKEEEQKA